MLSAPPAITTLSMPAMMLAGRALHRGHARRAVPVERDARHLDEAELDRGVAGDVAAALEHFAHLRVVDVAARDAGALQRLAHRVLGEVERAHVEQRALAGGPDRGAGPGNDDGVRHDFPLERCDGAESVPDTRVSAIEQIATVLA